MEILRWLYRRIRCRIRGHGYLVHHHLTDPLSYDVSCSECGKTSHNFYEERSNL